MTTPTEQVYRRLRIERPLLVQFIPRVATVVIFSICVAGMEYSAHSGVPNVPSASQQSSTSEGGQSGSGALRNREALEPPAGPITGIWYSTWYANKGHYVWGRGHGFGSTNQMLADVNGDGRADAVVFFASGDWWVALSTGNGFAGSTKWVAGHGSGSTRQMLADVNADGRADAVVFFGSGSLGGKWYVALSNGNGFGGYTEWGAGHGVGSTNQMLADVNADGRADAVVFFGSGSLAGRWYVARSSGNGFINPPNKNDYWAIGHGGFAWPDHPSDRQFVADIYGTKKAAPLTFTLTDGTWRALPPDLYRQLEF